MADLELCGMCNCDETDWVLEHCHRHNRLWSDCQAEKRTLATGGVIERGGPIIVGNGERREYFPLLDPGQVV